MRISYDESTGASYVYIYNKIEPGEVDKTVEYNNGDVMIDFDKDGNILGIEVTRKT